MQVDVIEAQFSTLLKAVENANEFEDVIKIHHEFITNLLAKTFVLLPDEVSFRDPSNLFNVNFFFFSHKILEASIDFTKCQRCRIMRQVR